jgi:hypothetical protein
MRAPYVGQPITIIVVNESRRCGRSSLPQIAHSGSPACTPSNVMMFAAVATGPPARPHS